MSERDWKEDSSHENGNYQCRCCICGEMFIGHKRRVECRVCSEKLIHEEMMRRQCCNPAPASVTVEVASDGEPLREVSDRHILIADEVLLHIRNTLTANIGIGHILARHESAAIQELQAELGKLKTENERLKTAYERAEDALEKAGVPTADKYGTLISVAEGVEVLQQQVADLTSRLAAVEAQNARLRELLTVRCGDFLSVIEGMEKAIADHAKHDQWAEAHLPRIRAALAEPAPTKEEK